MSSNEHFGLLNLDKPGGVSSRAVVDQVVRLVRPLRAGHAGTLDPMATGVLVVCVGMATRLIPIVQQLAKGYLARFRLGWRSDTDDVTGEIEKSDAGADVTREQIEALLERFVGRIEQVPPKYSAVHVSGERAYKLARQGRKVAIEPRTVEVYAVNLLSYSYPDLELQIECGSGTYIRSIGRDLGELLGCGAVMSKLQRTHIGPFGCEAAIDPSRLTTENFVDSLLPAAAAVGDLPRYDCTPEEIGEIVHGRRFVCREESSFDDTAQVAVFDSTRQLACLARFRADDGTLAPKQVFVKRG